MALIIWNSTYSVNIAEIDNQHKKLVDLINQLHESMKMGKANEQAGKIFAELINYTLFHFNYEEDLMAKGGYDDIEDHKDVHRSIKEKVKALQKEHMAGSSKAIVDTLTFLQNWLMKHIAGTDKKYTTQLNAKGIV